MIYLKQLEEPVDNIGIDISKDFFDACIRTNKGQYFSDRFENSNAGFEKFLKWSKKKADTQAADQNIRFGMESTGPYGVPLAFFLYENQYQIAPLNPRRVKEFGRSQGKRVKTDAVDSKVIADFISVIEPYFWTPPAEALRELQNLNRHREGLVRKKVAASNQLKSLRALGDEAERTANFPIKQLETELEFFKKQIKEIGRKIDQLIQGNSCLQQSENLLLSIPGVGTQVARSILTEIPLITAFKRARDVSAFVGVTPNLAESGKSVRKRGNMTKEGSSMLRKKLYMAALAASRGGTALQRSYGAMIDRGKPAKVALCALMNRIIRIAFGVLKHQSLYSDSLTKIA